MSFRFEKLDVWKDARAFIILIYQLTSKFPKEEKFGLIDQLRRAAVSIALNIAEGSDRKSDVEFIRFLRMSITSVNEVVTAFYIARDLSYLPINEFQDVYNKANNLASRINALINILKKQ